MTATHRGRVGEAGTARAAHVSRGGDPVCVISRYDSLVEDASSGWIWLVQWTGRWVLECV